MKSWVLALVLWSISVCFFNVREFCQSGQAFAPPEEGDKWAEQTLFIDIAGG